MDAAGSLAAQAEHHHGSREGGQDVPGARKHPGQHQTPSRTCQWPQVASARVVPRRCGRDNGACCVTAAEWQSLQKPSRRGSVAIGALGSARADRSVPGSELLEALLAVLVGRPPDGGAEALGEANSGNGRNAADEGGTAGASRDTENAGGHYEAGM